jgi:hypothetical protein
MVERTGNSKKKSIVVGIFCERVSDTALSHAFDVEPVLLRFYRVSALLLGTPCPTPPRLLLSDNTSPPPFVPEEFRPTPATPVTPEQREQFKKAMERMKGPLPWELNGATSDKAPI